MILDTNALSAFADGQAAATTQIASAKILAVPVIVLGEYRYGIAMSRMRSRYEGWLTGFLPACRILDVTDATTVHYAELRAALKRGGTPVPVNDVWIAALCRQHALPLLSRDRHFDLIRDIRRVSW